MADFRLQSLFVHDHGTPAEMRPQASVTVSGLAPFTDTGSHSHMSALKKRVTIDMMNVIACPYN